MTIGGGGRFFALKEGTWREIILRGAVYKEGTQSLNWKTSLAVPSLRE